MPQLSPPIGLAPVTLDAEQFESELRRITEVTAARVVVDDGGRPIEIHILARPDKHPKQLVRDVQSVAQAAFGLDLDRRMVSIVQLERGGEVAAGSDDKASPRIVVGRVTATRAGLDCHVEVLLRRGDDRATGLGDCSIATSAILRTVAAATLSALRELEPAAERLDVETAAVVRLGERSVAVVSVIFLLPPHEEVVTGSAVVREMGDLDAVARAVLDATNRRIVQLR